MAEGVFFSDPVDHMPLRYDLYDANKKYADSRNIAVVGMTGGGKTVTLEKVVDAYHHDKTAEYINIIVDWRRLLRQGRAFVRSGRSVHFQI